MLLVPMIESRNEPLSISCSVSPGLKLNLTRVRFERVDSRAQSLLSLWSSSLHARDMQHTMSNGQQIQLYKATYSGVPVYEVRSFLRRAVRVSTRPRRRILSTAASAGRKLVTD